MDDIDSTPNISDDIRFGEIIKREYGKESGYYGDLVLLGFPYDIGVARNGGRVGAKQGPFALRKLMGRIGTVVNVEYNADLSELKVSDCGDIDESLNLEEAHLMLRKRVNSIIGEGKVAFVIGGGNDQSYPNACGLLDSLANKSCSVGVVNIDAHLDVRPLKNGLVHSGSPFRQLLEDVRFDGSRFAEFACQGHQCSSLHAEYVISKKGNLFWLSHLRKHGNIVDQFENVLNNLGDYIFVSFDLDSVSSSDAPGVSCPGAVGLTAQEALELCFTAGKHANVKLFDLSEYNPVIEEYRTGRLVANMFYFFALGLSMRRKRLL